MAQTLVNLAPLMSVRVSLASLRFGQRMAIAGIAALRITSTALDLCGIILVGVVVSIVSGTTIAKSSALGQVLDVIQGLGFQNGYAVLSVVAIMFFILKGVLSIWLSYVTSTYLAKLEAEKARQIFQELLSGDLSHTDGLSRQELLFAVTRSINVLTTETLTLASAMVGEIALLIGVSVYLASANFPLFVIVALFFGIVGYGMHHFLSKRASAIGERAQSGFLNSQAVAMGAFENLRQIRVFGETSSFVREFDSARTSLARQTAFNSIVVTLPRYITEIAVMLGVGLLVLLRSTEGIVSVSAPTIAVFLVGLFRIVASMLPLQSGLTALSRNQAEASLALELLRRQKFSTKEESEPGQRDEGLQIELTNVSFRYDDSAKEVLSDVSLQVPAGKFVAITGKSGAGKSTVADLVIGMRKTTSGTVRLAGLGVEDFKARNPGGIGYVPQRVNLIAGTVRKNLLLGRQQNEGMLDGDLLAMLVRLGLSGDGSSRDLSLDDVLGEGGSDLSGGQIQRLGLARVLIGKPELIVLDESTSALDPETSSRISSILDDLKGTVTLFVIAHNAETIRNADQVYDLADGVLTKVSG